MKKIIYVIDNLEQGGAQKLIFDIIYNLKSSYKFTILAFEGGVFEQRFKDIGINVMVLGISPFKIGIKYPFNILKTLSWLKNQYRKIQPDIIQTHLIGADIWARMAAKKTSAKIIQTIHSAETFRGKTSSRLGLKTYMFDRKLEKYTNLIICVSSAARESILIQGIEKKKTAVIHCGIDTDAFKPDANCKKEFKEEFKINEKTTVLGTVGRLEKVKGFDVLICAIAKTKDLKNIRLFIAGEGTEYENLKKLISKYSLNDTIILLGRRTDINKLLNMFDIFVFSSHYEGLPLALLEAMANRKTILATNVGGIPEAISNNQNGCLVKPNSPDEIADKIKYLIDNPKIASDLAQNAYRTVLDFDIKNIAKKYKSAYNKLLN